jgi:hypothetical protein
MTRVRAKLVARISNGAIAFRVTALFAASARAEDANICGGDVPSACRAVFKKYGDFSNADARDLEQHVLFQEFAGLCSARESAGIRFHAEKQALTEAKALAVTVKRMQSYAKQEAEEQAGLSGARQRTLRPAAMPGPCFDQYVTELEAAIVATRKEGDDLDEAAKRKLAEACAAVEAARGGTEGGEARPGEAVMTLTLVELNEVNGWDVKDGKIIQKGPAYEAVYTWSPPPANISASGFSRLLMVTGKADKGQRAYVGITASAGGLQVTAPAPPAKAEVFADAQGNTATNSFVLTARPA